MADQNPTRALAVVDGVEKMCDFMESPVITTALEHGVPVSMPPAPGALGFDIPLWVGLGVVGVWAALDAFAERAQLRKSPCSTCQRKLCVAHRFRRHAHGVERVVLAELEDLRHLYAHNYAGDADDEYFLPHRRRHVLAQGAVIRLTTGAQFDGRRIHLDLSQLRAYAATARTVLRHFP